jgi:SAM-dependent methyltransferase
LPTSMLFNQISSYWAEMADANATEKQVGFVLRHLEPAGLVLDLGCGNGRHTVPLCKAGYEVIGLDVSQHLLQLSKGKAAKVESSLALVRADMRFLPFRAEVFAAVLSLDTSFGYLPSENEDLQSLTELSKTLMVQGVLLLDVFNRERMLQRHGKMVGFGLWTLLFTLLQKFPWLSALFGWREYPSFCLLQKRSMDIKTGLMRDLWVFKDRKTGKIDVEKHVVRLYGFSSLQILLGKAKLDILRVYGGYEEITYDVDSSRLIILAAKMVEG